MRIRAVYFIASRRETASIEWMLQKNNPRSDHFIPRIKESICLWVNVFDLVNVVYFYNYYDFFLAPARAQENSDDDSDDEAEDSDESDIPGK